jgi:hypothetical protein
MTVFGVSFIVGGLALVAAGGVVAYRNQSLQAKGREREDAQGNTSDDNVLGSAKQRPL